MSKQSLSRDETEYKFRDQTEVKKDRYGGNRTGTGEQMKIVVIGRDQKGDVMSVTL